jgi:hypothetical protein
MNRRRFVSGRHHDGVSLVDTSKAVFYADFRRACRGYIDIM